MITQKTYKPLLPLIVTLCSICILLGILTACQTDEYPVAGVTRTVSMTVNVTRQSETPSSRATLTETGENEQSDITATWTQGDILIVKAADGTHMGTLTYDPVTSSEDKASFIGEVETNAVETANCHFFYFGSDCFESDIEINEIDNFTLSYATQGGTLAWIEKHDVYSASTSVDFGKETAETPTINLERPLAFGHFKLVFPERVTYEGGPISLSAENLSTSLTLSTTNAAQVGTASVGEGETEKVGTITINPPKNSETTYSNIVDLYIAIIAPDDIELIPTFSTKIGEEEYSCTLDPHLWQQSQFIHDGYQQGFTVTMQANQIEKEDPDNPLTKFAKTNLIRISPRGSSEIVNGFAEDETHPGALFQWGRNYGFMPVEKGWFTESAVPENFKEYYKECITNGELYSHWLDAFGSITSINNKTTPEYIVVLPSSSFPIPLAGVILNGSNINVRSEIQSDWLYYNEGYNTKYIMEGHQFTETETSITHSGSVEYWPFEKVQNGETWEGMAEHMNYYNTTNSANPTNPCPEGWRLPTPKEFQSILPSIIWTASDGKGLHAKTFDELIAQTDVEIKTMENGKRYAFRWLKADQGLKIQAVTVGDDFSEGDQIIWTSNKVVTRIFPFTGRIEDCTIRSYPTISLPFYLHNPLQDSQEILSKETSTCIDLSNVSNLNHNACNRNRFFGGYWTSPTWAVFSFHTEDVKISGFGEASIELGVDQRPYAYAIRPVRDENYHSNAKRK